MSNRQPSIETLDRLACQPLSRRFRLAGISDWRGGELCFLPNSRCEGSSSLNRINNTMDCTLTGPKACARGWVSPFYIACFSTISESNACGVQLGSGIDKARNWNKHCRRTTPRPIRPLLDFLFTVWFLLNISVTKCSTCVHSLHSRPTQGTIMRPLATTQCFSPTASAM